MTTFADLHTGPQPLLLPNAWDVASALVFAEAGFAAVGTSSMGVAACVGLPDGRRGSRDATVRIAEALEQVPVHVTADIEDGYADDPAEVAAFVDSLPVAGLNIEDSRNDLLVAPRLVADKVAAIKQRRPDVFVNVRVDTFWFHQDDTVESTLERASVYVAAGADGIFVPGVTDADLITRLAGSLDVPLNVLAVPGASLEELGRLGVRRVSTGSLPYRVALQAALDTAEAVRVGGDLPGALSYPAVQDILSA
jgi:2-methylisocitrate lyase-like PEP mutase family enzyme